MYMLVKMVWRRESPGDKGFGEPGWVTTASSIAELEEHRETTSHGTQTTHSVILTGASSWQIHADTVAVGTKLICCPCAHLQWNLGPGMGKMLNTSVWGEETHSVLLYH